MENKTCFKVPKMSGLLKLKMCYIWWEYSHCIFKIGTLGFFNFRIFLIFICVLIVPGKVLIILKIYNFVHHISDVVVLTLFYC